MNVTVKEVAALDREVTISIAASQVEKLMDQTLGRIAGTVQLPGFRPGKIPKQVLESRFRDHLSSQVIEQLVQDSYPKALADKALRPAGGRPEFTMGEVKRGEDFTYIVRLEIYPNVEPQGYTALSLTRYIVTATEADVDDVVQQIRTNHARYESDAEHKAALGDQVLLDYTGYMDGEPFAGGQANDHLLGLGQGQFIPGFEAQLVGCGVGEERQVRVHFPDTYHADHLAGKEAAFDCKIKDIRRQILPPEEDSLAELAGIKVGGIAEMRTEIQKQLQSKIESESNQKMRKAISEQLLASNATVDVPSSLLKKECQAMAARVKKEYQEQGLDPKEIGVSDAELESNCATSSKERLVLGMLMGAIAKKEQIHLDDTILNAHIDEMAKAYGEQAGEMKRWLRESEERMESFRSTLMEQQVIHWITTHNTVTEQTCTFKELMGKSVPAEG